MGTWTNSLNNSTRASKANIQKLILVNLDLTTTINIKGFFVLFPQTYSQKEPSITNSQL